MCGVGRPLTHSVDGFLGASADPVDREDGRGERLGLLHPRTGGPERERLVAVADHPGMICLVLVARRIGIGESQPAAVQRIAPLPIAESEEEAHRLVVIEEWACSAH